MTHAPSPSPSSVVARVFWMMVGPMVLFALAFTIVLSGSGWFTLLDLAFLTILCGLVLARWWEFREGQPLTTTGEPAPPDHLPQYVRGALLAGVGTWAVANAVGNHVLVQ